MKKENKLLVDLNEHLGCYGNFSVRDFICREFCALSIRCAIEHDQGVQLEILEDLVDSERMVMTVQ